jgi:hypothetical protein
MRATTRVARTKFGGFERGRKILTFFKILSCSVYVVFYVSVFVRPVIAILLN